MRASSAVLIGVVALAAILATHADARAARACGARGAERPLLARPVGGAIFSTFGPRYHPLLGYTRLHSGVDYAAEAGDHVRVAAAGRVVAAGREAGYGKRVVVRHARDLKTAYAHLGTIRVRTGSCVEAGAVIGKIGKTGTAGRPAHLHFEVIQSGRFVDPARVVGW